MMLYSFWVTFLNKSILNKANFWEVAVFEVHGKRNVSRPQHNIFSNIVVINGFVQFPSWLIHGQE